MIKIERYQRSAADETDGNARPQLVSLALLPAARLTFFCAINSSRARSDACDGAS